MRTCGSCGIGLPYRPGPGPQRQFCDAKCRKRAERLRERRAVATAGEGTPTTLRPGDSPTAASDQARQEPQGSGTPHSQDSITERLGAHRDLLWRVILANVHDARAVAALSKEYRETLTAHAVAVEADLAQAAPTETPERARTFDLRAL